MLSKLQGPRVAGLTAAIPSPRVTQEETASRIGLTPEECQKVVKMTGVASRVVAPEGVCASDLAAASADRLLDELRWDRSSVDVLIFVSQTFDQPLPATACGLQSRLGLATQCAAFDISLGCSGSVYGLWTAASLIAARRSGRTLLLVGDTISRVCAPGDRATSVVFGDAGAAIALDYDSSAAPMTFVLGTDGSGKDHLIQRAGGESHLYMDGGEVFSFTLQRVPAMISDLLDLHGWSAADVSMFVPHQANEFMLKHLAKKVGLGAEKMTVALRDFGNTSCASIPLAMASALGSRLRGGPENALLAGFGVGWSWGAAALTLERLIVPEVVVYEAPTAARVATAAAGR